MKYLIAVLLGFMVHPGAFASSIGDQFAQAIIQRYQPTINTLSNHGWDHSNSIILHGFEKLYKKGKKQNTLTIFNNLLTHM